MEGSGHHERRASMGTGTLFILKKKGSVKSLYLFSVLQDIK
jgi:hypothetical protein